MGDERARREFWWLAVTALLVLGAGIGLRDPWPSDEPRFALVARQMVESGQWLFPQRGTELYSDKPPMLMWLQAAVYLLVRDWRIAFLLPSLLAALATLACVYDLGRRLWTRRVGLYAAWLLLLTVQFTFQARKAQIDPLLLSFMTLANYGLLRHLLRGPDWRMWMLGWFAAGLGMITKGVGVLALLVLLPALFAVVRGWLGVDLHWRDRRIWLGPLAFAGALALWLGPLLAGVWRADDPAHYRYLHDILLRQTAGRYLHSWDHHNPPWYHLGVMLTLWLPAALALPWALPAWRRRLRRGDPRYLLLLGWWLLLVVFFSIPSGKRDVYILPALPVFCLALAPLWPGLLRRRGFRRLLLGFTAALVLLLLGAGASVLWGSDAGRLQALIARRALADDAVRRLGWVLLAIGMWGGGGLLLAARKWPARVLAALLALLWVLQGLLVNPLLNDSSSGRGLMREVGRRLGPDAELGLVAWKEQNLLLADRPARTFGFKRPWEQQLQAGMVWQAQRPQRRWLLVQEKSLLDCIVRGRSQRVGTLSGRAWWLVPATAIEGRCIATPAQREWARRDQGPP
ncbi:dolichyl-phosphate-mannose-protein mannosyltransferase [Stenotrophomonas pictorum JCM 9942]|uniref:Dolichyl-phosphate-mannose-protein mannosyltransferase n=2 Tax=Stenotrophomonas pictorum TaxID=86184 RepID=A0A0R0A7F7_9GAMM|nr:glycosyltransferase family 39 protein [Stenotrophomonas pictorum]KRG40927.1 dolichyl-phosphate-mannose-protein mannosyltransferase [Stenotrophomonas pictorum JCM 9942]